MSPPLPPPPPPENFNHTPKDGELNGRHGNNSPQGMDDTKINRQRDRRIGQLNGRHENNSPKGWTAQNNSPKQWTDGELYGRHKKKLTKGLRINWSARK